jgi:hypothetical protein
MLFQRAGEPPSVPFRVPSTVLTLTVGLVLGLTVHPGTALTRVYAMRVDIVYADDQTASGHGLRARRSQIVFRGCAMQPD